MADWTDPTRRGPGTRAAGQQPDAFHRALVSLGASRAAVELAEIIVAAFRFGHDLQVAWGGGEYEWECTRCGSWVMWGGTLGTVWHAGTVGWTCTVPPLAGHDRTEAGRG